MTRWIKKEFVEKKIKLKRLRKLFFLLALSHSHAAHSVFVHFSNENKSWRSHADMPRVNAVVSMVVFNTNIIDIKRELFFSYVTQGTERERSIGTQQHSFHFTSKQQHKSAWQTANTRGAPHLCLYFIFTLFYMRHSISPTKLICSLTLLLAHTSFEEEKKKVILKRA